MVAYLTVYVIGSVTLGYLLTGASVEALESIMEKAP